METRVKIFCTSEEICALLKKVLSKHNLSSVCENYSAVSGSKSNDDIISECRNTADIVVLDPELDKDFKLNIVQSLKSTTFICLPSLEENDISEAPANVHKISEPFKLSEFEDVLMKLINDK